MLETSASCKGRKYKHKEWLLELFIISNMLLVTCATKITIQQRHHHPHWSLLPEKGNYKLNVHGRISLEMIKNHVLQLLVLLSPHMEPILFMKLLNSELLFNVVIFYNSKMYKLNVTTRKSSGLLIKTSLSHQHLTLL